MSICSICREAREEIVSAHVNITHEFCKECLLQWVSTSDTLNCPLCRHIIDNCCEIFDDKAELLYLLSDREDGCDMIKQLLEEGIDPSDNRDKILEKALEYGKVELVKILIQGLERAPNVDPAGLVKTGHFDLLRYFMTTENMQNFGEHVIYELVKHGQLRSTSEIIKSSCLGDWAAPLVLAAQMGNQELLKAVFEQFESCLRENYFLVIGAAILAGQVETVNWILDSFPIIAANVIPASEWDDLIICTDYYIDDYEVSLPDYFIKGIKSEFYCHCDCCITPLSLACRVGNLKLVQDLHTKYHMDLSANACSSLFSALYSGNFDLIRYLLDNGVDVTARYNFAFHMAGLNDRTELFNLLCEYRQQKVADYDEEFIELVKFLLDMRMWDQAETLLKRKRNIQVVLTEEYYISTLEFVIKDNSIGLAKILLENDIYQNSCTSTLDRTKKLLFRACVEGNSDVVELFLHHQPFLLKFDDGYECLKAAIENSRSETVKQLILKGADMHVSMEGSDDNCACKSMLHMTIKKKMYDAAALLIDHGADINADARFLLDELCEEGQLDLLRKLIDHGCTYKPFLEEALLIAAAHDQVKVILFLHQRGDDVFCDGKVLKEAIMKDSFEVVKFLCTKKLGEAEIKDVWSTALSSSTSPKLLRHLASVYPFEKSLYEEEISDALKAGHMPHLKFLLQQGMNFDEAFESIEIDSEKYDLDAALLISTVTDGWMDQYQEEFLQRAIHEFHRGLLEYYEAKLGTCALLDASIRFLSGFPDGIHNDYHGGTKHSIKYFLKKDCFCVSSSFVNHCLRIACNKSDSELVGALQAKGANCVAARKPHGG